MECTCTSAVQCPALTIRHVQHMKMPGSSGVDDEALSSDAWYGGALLNLSETFMLLALVWVDLQT